MHQARYNAFIEKHLGYLASGDAILLAEAIEVLRGQVTKLAKACQDELIALLRYVETEYQQGQVASAEIIQRCSVCLQQSS